MSLRFNVGDVVRASSRTDYKYTITHRHESPDGKKWYGLRRSGSGPLVSRTEKELIELNSGNKCVVCGTKVEIESGLMAKHYCAGKICYGSFMPRANS